MAVPGADGGHPAEVFPYVGGSGAVAVNSGERILSDARDFVRGVEFRRRGDLRARCGTVCRETGPAVETLIARVILQGYSHEEAGKVMGCSRRMLERNLPEALDRSSEIFLAAEILEPVEGPRASDEEACQEGGEEGNLVIV